MLNLLKNVVDAHGGIDRWKTFSKLEATIVAGGEFWGMKGLPGDDQQRQVTVWLHEQRTTLNKFGDPKFHLDFGTGVVKIINEDGGVVAERTNPRGSFAGHTMTTPWDPLHLAYFDGYALRTYLTTPFLLATPGVEVSELEPWREGNESWRVLRAKFPSSIDTHGTVQDFYFGDDLLLRRHNYPVEVAGGFWAAHLVSDYVEANGIKLPTRRRAYQRTDKNEPQPKPLMVSIDVSNARFS